MLELSLLSARPGHGARARTASHALPGMQEQCPGCSGVTMSTAAEASLPLVLVVQINQCQEGNTSPTQHIFQQKRVPCHPISPACSRAGSQLWVFWGRLGTAGTDPAPQPSLGCQHQPCPCQDGTEVPPKLCCPCARLSGQL